MCRRPFRLPRCVVAEGQDVMPEFNPSRTGYYFYLFPRVQGTRQKSPHLTYCLALFDYF